MAHIKRVAVACFLCFFNGKLHDTPVINFIIFQIFYNQFEAFKTIPYHYFVDNVNVNKLKLDTTL